MAPPAQSLKPPPGGAGTKPWLDEPTLMLRERLAGAPAVGRVKGWLLQSVIDGAKRHGVELEGMKRCVGFKDYPLRDYLEVLAQAAVRARPTEPPLETLRVLGREVYGTFAQSLLGKVIRAGLGEGHDGARSGLKWVAHVYKVTSSDAVAQVIEPGNDVAIIELSNVWSFPEAYHVGIFEGAAQAFDGRVTVGVRRESLSAATLTFTWRD